MSFRHTLTSVMAKYGLDGRAETIAATAIRVFMRDEVGDILLCTGLTMPPNAGDGYAKGCLFIDTNVASGTGGLYCNKGTKDSCVFTLVTQG